MRKQEVEKAETALMALKAPAEFFERLDKWRLRQSMTMKPSRPALIRWIVHNFLLREEQKEARKTKRAKAPARR